MYPKAARIRRIPRTMSYEDPVSQIFIDKKNRRLKVKPETLANTEDGTLGLEEEEYSENSTNVQPSIEER